jgi:hypothetical protein
MSTLQHTLQPAFRSRLALFVIAAAALAALTVTLIIATSSSSTGAPAAQPSRAELQRQLEAVSSARYGIQPPQPSAAQVRAEDQRPVSPRLHAVEVHSR